MCQQAKITVTPFKWIDNVGTPQDHLEAVIVTSTDLPAHDLGDVTAQAVENIWKDGGDPVDYRLQISFGVAS
jgi:hypothetical protein